jgi:hypothetical protein
MMMRIDDYRFGRIVIDGRVFTRDVLLLGTRVHSPWWRRQGHRLDIADLDMVLGMHPQVLVIGTGASGNMEVPDETLEALATQGIRCQVVQTSRAVELFNRLREEEGDQVAAALHLTC